MNKNILALAILFRILALASGQYISKGTCPDNINVAEDFSVEKYLGKWYEYAKYPVYFELNGKCITAEYSLKEDNLVSVKNSIINERTNDYTDILGNATVVSNAKLLVTFPITSALTVSSSYWILDTDYYHYSVVYSCTPLTKFSHATTVWILTRNPFPGNEIVEQAIQVLKENNISVTPLQMTNQLSCN